MAEGKANYRGVIIGAGHFSDVQLEAWQSVKGAEIVAIFDIDASKAELLAQKYGIQGYDRFDQMIADTHPDFIDICTPPASHYEYVRLAVDLGLPALCQKPLAPTLEESEQLVRYATERGLPLMVNENWRWQPWYRHIKNIIASGRLGQVYYAYFSMRPGDGWGENPYPVQPYFKSMEKFLMFETGIHFIDTFRFLFGEIDSVYCQSRRINPVIKGEDLSIMFANFVNGMVGVYDANRVAYTPINRSPTYGSMVIEGTEGKVRLDEEGRIYVMRRGGAEEEYRYDIPDGYKGGSAIAAQQHFADCLRTGSAFETSGTDYLTNMRILFTCYESMQNSSPIAL
ncbi:Gfo/Idh/MocA family protein [Cohnella thailandensis]|uniref:Gfo/Idh/MocA family oxidoreductase n=1 Tax=Cohnella thailandensis TaxID=557557 RepID=A0A841SYL9_9BACL|nr:Gfo/Idh/MocA family oxidoreductase [Cohnella thailandensis]MBB6637313.1 Gfo/Idh/MocA family oxidoreductase [Cohnella thailandensis]MBP1976641.1 putative dehydrogenase [Cohnella thailandensis]